MATIVGTNDSGEETLTGGSDGDTLIGGKGKNTLYGNGGADIFTVSERLASGSGSHDVIKDFELGVDKIDVSVFGISSWDQLAAIRTDTGSETYLRAYYGSHAYTIEISGVTFSSLTASDFIFSESGAKTETGTLAGDRLFGSTAADTLYGSDGYDELYGGDGNDTLYGGSDSNSDDAVDQLIGGNGDDTLYGNRDDMDGGDGNDILIASNGYHNAYTGGSGADIFRFVAGPKAYQYSTVTDFTAGVDKIDVSDLGVSSWEQLKPILRENGADTVFTEIELSNVKISDLNASDFVFSTSGARNITGSDDADTIFGSAYADKLSGGYGDDVLLGGEGNDTLQGGYDYNDLYGGGGADIFKMSARLTDEQSGSHLLSINTSRDDIHDFKIGVDRVDVSAFGISTFDQLKVILEKESGATYFNAFYAGREHAVFLEGVILGKLTASDFIFYTGAPKKGTSLSDSIFGSAKADILSASGVGDLLVAGAGNDVLIIGGAGNVL